MSNTNPVRSKIVLEDRGVCAMLPRTQRVSATHVMLLSLSTLACSPVIWQSSSHRHYEFIAITHCVHHTHPMTVFFIQFLIKLSGMSV
jgi:hypothetical protein